MEEREFKVDLKDISKIVSFVNLPENAVKWAIILK
jgi:hypothetical protein